MDRLQRRLQRDRSILVDALVAPRARLGGGAVLLSLAGLGEHARLRDLGRGADALARHRLRDRGRLRPVPVVAREQRATVTDHGAGRRRVALHSIRVRECAITGARTGVAGARQAQQIDRVDENFMRLFAIYHS